MAYLATATKITNTKLTMTLKPTIFLGKGGAPVPTTGQMWPRGAGKA